MADQPYSEEIGVQAGPIQIVDDAGTPAGAMSLYPGYADIDGNSYPDLCG
jgi:hypothetical protein